MSLERVMKITLGLWKNFMKKYVFTNPRHNVCLHHISHYFKYGIMFAQVMGILLSTSHANSWHDKNSNKCCWAGVVELDFESKQAWFSYNVLRKLHSAQITAGWVCGLYCYWENSSPLSAGRHQGIF